MSWQDVAFVIAATPAILGVIVAFIAMQNQWPPPKWWKKDE